MTRIGGSPARRPSPGLRAPDESCSPATPATCVWPMPSIIGPSRHSRPRPEHGPSTTIAGQQVTPTTPRYDTLETVSSAFSTAASPAIPSTARTSPGAIEQRSNSHELLDSCNRGISTQYGRGLTRTRETPPRCSTRKHGHNRGIRRSWPSSRLRTRGHSGDDLGQQFLYRCPDPLPQDGIG